MTITATKSRRRLPIAASALDIEILRALVRCTAMRGHHLASWTGASSWTIRRRMQILAERDLVRSSTLSLHLRDKTGVVRPSQCYVWSATARGAAIAGATPWAVPGTGETIALGVHPWSRLMSDHLIGCVDLLVWYRVSGFAVTVEREILSLERATKLHPTREVQSYWSVTVPGRAGIHPPDLGAVGPDGTMWAIELERATKTVEDYRTTISAYRAAGRPQIWHVMSKATSARLLQACRQLGVQWGPPPSAGMRVSSDGTIRIQGWLPGRVGRGPDSWPSPPRVAPAGFPEVKGGRPDLSASWRRGRVIDIDADESLGGVFF